MPQQPPKFVVGQVVKLKSGSPSMTIVDVQQNGKQVTVAWIGKDDNYRTAPVPTDALTTPS